MPLDDLLTFLATMFDLSWRVVPGQGEKPPSYELWQSPQRVIIRSVSEEVNQALLEASLYLPTDALAGEEVWLQAQRTVRHHWACVDTGTNPHSVSDLLFSKPGESLRAFRQQVKDAHKKKFVPAEVEVITLHLGARGRTIASPTIELVRLGIGKKGYP